MPNKLLRSNFELIAYVLHSLCLYLSAVGISVWVSVLFCDLKALSASEHEIDLIYVLFGIFRKLW